MPRGKDLKPRKPYKSHSQEARDKKSETSRALWQQPGHRDKVIASLKRSSSTLETKQRRSEASKASRTFAVRKAISEKLAGKPKSLATRKKMSENHNTSDEYRATLSENATERNFRYSDVISARMIRLWQETPDKMIGKHDDHAHHMSSIEEKVWSIVQPLGFLYEPRFYRVEDINILPDFVRGNLVIEVQGEYWHTQEQTKERERLLNLLGKKVLFIWGKELSNKNIIATREKIMQWILLHEPER